MEEVRKDLSGKVNVGKPQAHPETICSTTIEELIGRLEKATGPDRELDLATHLAIYPDGDIAKLMQFRRGFDHKEGMAWDIHHGGSVCFEKWTADGRCTYNGGYPLPAYTASIDAALTLAPLWSWRVGNLPSGMGFADLGTQASMQCIEGATPALALCIAALKARQSSAESQSK